MRISILVILITLSFEIYGQTFQIIDDPTNTGLDASNHAETMAEEKAQKEIEKAEEQAQKSFQEKFAEYQKKLSEASDYVKNSREMVEATEYMYSSTEKIAMMIKKLSENETLTTDEIIRSIESINSYMSRMFSTFEDMQQLIGALGKEPNMRDAQRLKKIKEKQEQLYNCYDGIKTIYNNSTTKNPIDGFRRSCEERTYNAMMFNL